MAKHLVDNLLQVAALRGHDWYIEEVKGPQSNAAKTRPPQSATMEKLVKSKQRPSTPQPAKRRAAAEPLRRETRRSSKVSRPGSSAREKPAAPRLLPGATFCLPGTVPKPSDARQIADRAHDVPSTLTSVLKLQKQTWNDGQDRIDRLNHLLRHLDGVMDESTKETIAQDTIPLKNLDLEVEELLRKIPGMSEAIELENLAVSEVSSVCTEDVEEEAAGLPQNLRGPRISMLKSQAKAQNYDEKVKQRKVEFIAQRLPPGVEHVERSMGGDSVLVLAPKGVPGAAPDDPEEHIAVRKQPELNGAIMQYGSQSISVEGRRKRWAPCFTALDDVENALNNLELYSRRVIGGDAPDHPTRYDRRDKEEVMGEGLRPEGDEVAEFLLVWMQDLQQRLQVLCQYEQTKKNNKLHHMGHRACQTAPVTFADEIEEELKRKAAAMAEREAQLEKQSKAAWYENLGADAEESSIYSKVGGTRRHSTSHADEGQHLGGGNFFAEGNASFARVAHRTIAVLRIQSVFRGYFTRSVVGNIPRGTRTLFSSNDIRISRMWCIHIVHRPVTLKPESWLRAVCSSLFLGKVSSHYISTSGNDITFSKKVQPFTDFMFEHFAAAFTRESDAEQTVIHFLRAVEEHRNADPLFAIAFHLVMGDFTPLQEDYLWRSLLPLARLMSRSDTMTVQFIAIDFEEDYFMTPQETKRVIRSLVKPWEVKGVLEKLFATAHTLFFTSGHESELTGLAFKRLTASVGTDSDEFVAVERRLSHKQLLLALTHAVQYTASSVGTTL